MTFRKKESIQQARSYTYSKGELIRQSFDNSMNMPKGSNDYNTYTQSQISENKFNTSSIDNDISKMNQSAKRK